MTTANRAARAGLSSLALTTSGMVWLVFDLVTDRTFAAVAGVVSLLFFTTLWLRGAAAGAATGAAARLSRADRWRSPTRRSVRPARRAGP